MREVRVEGGREMTREEAADLLHRLRSENYLDDYDHFGEQEEIAIGIAIAALRGPEWVRTADRLPAVEDGIIGATGEPEVLAVTRYAHGYFPDMKMVSEICIPLGSKYYPYWMPLPKLPEVEG
jgi:hypothetical protein